MSFPEKFGPTSSPDGESGVVDEGAAPSQSHVSPATPVTDAPTQRRLKDRPNLLTTLLQRFFNPSTGTIAMAIVAALLLSGLIVVIFNADVQKSAGYFFARPGDTIAAVSRAFSDFFVSLFRGSIFDVTQKSFAAMIKPLTETLTRAVPLTIAGLAISVSFRAGLFNIGVQGQLIMGALIAGFVGFHFDLPMGVHLLAAIMGAIIGGALWGLIPGFLKAKLGANEVIVTIMLNSIALYLLQYLLSTPTFVGPSGYSGKSQNVSSNAVYPLLFGPQFRLHWGFIVAIVMMIFTAWLLKRSTFGFELRAAGANAGAAQTAGINVPRTLMLTLVLSGALAGLAGSAPVLGTEKALTVSVAGSYGFDAITVALLGKSKPMGVLFAGILFGALNAGGSLMQARAGIPSDIVQITQAIIVLLIAASEALRYMRKRKKVTDRAATPTAKEEAVA